MQHSGKEPACQCRRCEMWVRSLGQEDPLKKDITTTPVSLPGNFCGQRSLTGYSSWACSTGLEKEMATHPSILAWRVPWTEEPGGLLSMGSHRVRHDWSNLACMHAWEKEMETHSSVLAWRIPEMEEPGGLPSMGSHRVGHDWSDLAAAAAAELDMTEQLSTQRTNILIWFCLHEVPRQGKLIKTESRIKITRRWVEEGTGSYGTEFFWGDEKVQK